MKHQRFMVVGDNHGDQIDPVCERAVRDFIKDFKPQIRVHLGDNWDFRNLRKGASDDEKAASLSDDWDAGTQFMRSFFDGGKETYFLQGNHDRRMWNTAHSATGLVRDFANDGIKRIEAIVRQSRAKMLPYDAALGILTLGKLSVLHGYHHGVGACRQHANIYRNSVFGHIHTIESAPVPSLEPAEARSIGCLCRRDMDYINAKTAKLRWGQGWAYGLVFDDGTYHLQQARNINGSFHAASDFKTY
jgi:hypothetical protein